MSDNSSDLLPGLTGLFEKIFEADESAGFQPVSGSLDVGNTSGNFAIDETNGVHLTGGSGTDHVVGYKTNGDSITLGNGVHDTVALLGNQNEIVLGNGAADIVWEFGDQNSVVVGNGNNDIVRVAGGHNSAVLGNGNNDRLTVSPFSHDGNFTLGSGVGDTVLSFGNGDTYSLHGSTSLAFVGGSNTVNIDGGGVTGIWNFGAGGDDGDESVGGSEDEGGGPGNQRVNIGAAGGVLGFKGFTDGSVIDLLPSAGFATAADALAAVTSDGHGGSLLNFANGHIDLGGFAPGSLTVNNFQIG